MNETIQHALTTFLRYNGAYLARFTDDSHKTPQLEENVVERLSVGETVSIRVTQSLYPIGGRFDTENPVKQTLFNAIAKLSIIYNVETEKIDVLFDTVTYEKEYVTKIDGANVTIY